MALQRTNKEERILALAMKGEENVNTELKIKYDLSSDKSELLRDIVALCNPLDQDGADDVAYLIIGAKAGQLFDTTGLSLDESDLRAILHAYIFPSVNFSFHIVEHESRKIVGIIIVRSPDLYIIQKRLITKKKKKIHGQEAESDDIVNPGECWLRDGTSKKQITGEQIRSYHYRFFKKKSDEQMVAVYERISQLETKLNTLQSAMPELSIHFGNKSTILSLKRPSINIKLPKNIKTPVEIRKELAMAKIDSYPDIIPLLSRGKPAGRLVASLINSLTRRRQMEQKVIELYNDCLNKYFAAYETYYEELITYYASDAQPIVLRLVIDNCGGSPANDLDIDIEFPTGQFDIYGAHDFVRPNAPSLPKKIDSNDYEIMTRRYTNYDPHGETVGQLILNTFKSKPESDLSQFITQKIPSLRSSYKLASLKHHRSQPLPVLRVVFFRNEIRNFQFSYSILVSNIPERVTGELRVVFE